MLCSWSGSNSIFVACAASPEGPRPTVSSSPTIVKQDYGYDSVPVRKLLNESHGIFIQFLDAARESEQNKFTSVGLLQNASKEFRVCIRACCQALERELAEINGYQQGNDDAGTIGKQQDLLQTYRHIDIIWSLCDVLFFRPQGAFLAPDLLEWSRWNFTEPDDAVKEMLEWQKDGGFLGLEEHEKYWDTICSFLLIGRVDEGQKLLMAHSRSSFDPALGKMRELLGGFPMSNPFQSADKTALLIWRAEVNRCMEDGIFMTIPQLVAICELLLGNDIVFQHMASIRPIWYQLVVGKVLFTEPYAKLGELQFLAEECLDLVSRPEQPLSSVDKILLSLFQLDILSALKELCSSFRNWWCPAHLGVLLWHGGCMELLTMKQDIDLREYLLLEYGESLVTSGLWQLAVDYLAACPTYGTNALRLVIERMPLPLKSCQKTLKVLDICRKYELLETAKSICNEKAMNSLKAGRYADALAWCLQAKDSQFATYVTEKLLLLDGGAGQLQNLPILDGLGETGLLSPSVAFLVKYRQMYILKSRGQLKESAAVLTELISSQVAPRQFWMVLFREFMDLVKAADGELIFDSAQTMALMDTLQTMLIETEYVKNRKALTCVPDETALRNDLKALRLTLVKGLASAFLQKTDA